MAEPLIGFITDTEGNFDYWRSCVEDSRVVRFGVGTELAFARPDARDIFVFGGDVFDKGPGDMRIASALVRFRRAHPDRVFLLVGNRDLNKLRFTAELAESHIDIPQPVPLYPRAPPQLSYRAFLEKLAGAQGIDVEEANVPANRLRWILDHTMTANGAFELRRTELALTGARGGRLLQAAAEGGGGDKGVPGGGKEEPVSDDDVLRSFLESVELEEGFVWQYLVEGQLALILGDTLFVHGGVVFDSLGWVPPVDMRYRTPSEGEVCGGRFLPDGHSIAEWVEALNAAYREGLNDFRAQPLWQAGGERRRGGEMLLCLTSTPACFSRSVVVECMIQAGMPVEEDPRIAEYLIARGVRRVVCGHKPCGDSPFAVRRGGVEFLHCDTTYSDGAAPDRRGAARASVELEYADATRRTRLRGVLRDGARYDCALQAPEASTHSGGQGCVAAGDGASRSVVAEDADGAPDAKRARAPATRAEEASALSSPPSEDWLGRRTDDGWWVKARLPDGFYHLARGASSPGERAVVYQRMALPAWHGSVHPPQASL